MTTLDKQSQNKKFNNYYYNKQLRNYILQFMAIFSDMKVAIGKNDNNDQSNLITVPIRYGDADRVVNSILTKNTQNAPIRLPIFSAHLADMQPAPDQQKGTGVVDKKVYLPVGNSFPDGLKVVHRRVPTPYALMFELSFYASNQDQNFQIIEQITSLFDPVVQFQVSDDPFSWMKIGELKLESLNFEENYPSDENQRIIVTSFRFTTTAWITVPIDFKSDFVNSVYVKLNIDPQSASSATLDDYFKIVDGSELNLPTQ